MGILNYFKALADETRIRLFNVLLENELSVNELVYIMDMGQSRISRHLKILTDSGLLQCRRDGVWAFYSINKSGMENEFAQAIRFLFKDESEFKEDMNNADFVMSERKNQSKLFFNRIAHEWDDLQQQILGDFDINSAIIEHVDPCEFAVDMGCGTGKLLFHLKEVAHVVLGVDSSPEMLEQARKLFREENNRVQLRLGELEHLPVGDREADFVTVSMALHHLSEPEAGILEAARILKRRGKLVIADFEKHENENMRKLYGDRWLGFTKEEILNLLSVNGLTLMDMESFPMNQSLKLNIYKANKN